MSEIRIRAWNTKKKRFEKNIFIRCGGNGGLSCVRMRKGEEHEEIKSHFLIRNLTCTYICTYYL